MDRMDQMDRPIPTQQACGSAAVPCRLEQLAGIVALLYIALLPLNIPLKGPLFAHDLMAPFFVAIVLWRKPWKRIFQFPDVLLVGFVSLALVATCVHLRSLNDVYELAIFAYMALLFWFFRDTRLPSRWLVRIALGTLAAFCVYALSGAMLGRRAVYGVYSGSSLGFMAKRFFFTFSHPNLVGSFYALPIICILTAATPVRGTVSPKKWLLLTTALGMLCIPLALTVSRHMLITGALLAGFAIANWQLPTKCTVPAFSLGLGAIFLLFYLMILFPFFPLRSSFPFFNHDTFGMYTIHQVVYLKMVFHDTMAFLFGLGKTGVQELYPLLADRQVAYDILAQYKQEFLTNTFVTYMDAHNEYLNLAAGFGVPAMLGCYSFWLYTARRAFGRREGALLVFYVASLLLVSLWDDIMSKRWIWIGLAILVQKSGERPRETGSLR